MTIRAADITEQRGIMRVSILVQLSRYQINREATVTGEINLPY